MLGDPNAICDVTATRKNMWIVGTKQNKPRCAVNVAKNKPAYQSGSPDRDDLLSEASKGTESALLDTITQIHTKYLRYNQNVLIVTPYQYFN